MDCPKYSWCIHLLRTNGRTLSSSRTLDTNNCVWLGSIFRSFSLLVSIWTFLILHFTCLGGWSRMCINAWFSLIHSIFINCLVLLSWYEVSFSRSATGVYHISPLPLFEYFSSLIQIIDPCCRILRPLSSLLNRSPV